MKKVSRLMHTQVKKVMELTVLRVMPCVPSWEAGQRKIAKMYERKHCKLFKQNNGLLGFMMPMSVHAIM